MAFRRSTLFEQTNESSLFKVMIAGQSLRYAPLLHNNNAGAIHQAPKFIRPVLEKVNRQQNQAQDQCE